MNQSCLPNTSHIPPGPAAPPLPAALLLDRDGTLIDDLHYLSDPEKVRLLPGVGAALAALAAAGSQLFVVTNQSGIGRAYFHMADFQACQERLFAELEHFQVRIKGSRFCPHSPEQNCACRKPAPGMWLSLQQEFALNPASSAMVGDKSDDLFFAQNAGLAAAFLVLSGKGAKSALKWGLGAEDIAHMQAHPHVRALPCPHPSGTRLYAATNMAALANFLLCPQNCPPLVELL